LYNIPQAVFDDALRENEVESENEEIEKEMEIELEDNGEEFIPADTDDESENEVIIDDIISKKIYFFNFFFKESDSGQPEEVDLDSSFESSGESDIEVCLILFIFFLIVTCIFFRIFSLVHLRKIRKQVKQNKIKACLKESCRNHVYQLSMKLKEKNQNQLAHTNFIGLCNS
jgi:hypothetical protein